VSLREPGAAPLLDEELEALVREVWPSVDRVWVDRGGLETGYLITLQLRWVLGGEQLRGARITGEAAWNRDAWMMAIVAARRRAWERPVVR